MTNTSSEAAGSRVRWLGRAADRVQENLKEQFTTELGIVFPAVRVLEITVHDCLGGYSADQNRKVILAVEVRTSAEIHTHMVKLGTTTEVETDYEGWRRCAGNRLIGGRIFVRVELAPLPQGRAAVVYDNAYTLFGLDQKTQYPEFLDDVAWWSITDDKPDPISVERVICQVYGDLYRWFYTSGKSDTHATRKFYKRRLDNALPYWSSQNRQLGADWTLPGHRTEAVERIEELRGDALWLLGGLDRPESTDPPAYLDPLDYLCWAFATDAALPDEPEQTSPAALRTVPPTLTGRSHGDLHGRNILVGNQRGEVEFPVVIDYGEMDDANVLVWDFVKLEMELKTRVLTRLQGDAAARDGVLAARRRTNQPPREAAPSVPFDHNERVRADRAGRLAFLFDFECRLAHETNLILAEEDADARMPPGRKREFFNNQKIDRALAILLRIRQEAALWLGYRQTGRHSLWLEEYFFALAVYGLATAKWANYTSAQVECALVSSGVAAARLSSARTALRELHEHNDKPPRNGPSYRLVLAAAHRKLNAGEQEETVRLIEQGRADFPHAIPLRTELALILAEQRDLSAARKVVEPLQRLCWVFGDFETLTRIGRTFKNMADSGWDALGALDPTPPEHSAPWQWYREAFLLYNDAFQISDGDYFPGVNAATLALLIGEHETSRALAAKVLDKCSAARLGATGENLYWIFATEGEAALISGLPDRMKLACSYYNQALSFLAADQIRMAQSSWDQICRLWRVLGASKVDPVVAIFKRYERLWPSLGAGPVGDCGLDGKR